jgi:hypothetical protein
MQKSVHEIRDFICSMRIHIYINELCCNNQEQFHTESGRHGVNTRNRDHVHRPTANLSCFQKSAYYADIKIFNSLPSKLPSLTNKKA